MVFYAPSFNIERWKMALADPDQRWKENHSAYELARAWANVRNLPACVQEGFDRSGLEPLRDFELLLKIPEHPVALDDRNDPVTNDLFALARSGTALFSMIVAGKGREPDGPDIRQAYGGAEGRLKFLMDFLGLNDEEALLPVRARLVQGMASAVMEAKRYHAGHALLLVHDFGQDDASFGDFARCAALFGVKAASGEIAAVPEPVGGVKLYLGWVSEARSRE